MSDVALRFGATDDGLTAQFRRVSRQLDDFDRQSRRVGASVADTFGKLATVVKAVSVGAVVAELLQFADQLTNTAASTGIAVEGLQRLSFIALQTSGDLGSISSAVNRMQKSLVLAGEGSREAAAALDRLGIPLAAFQNLAPDQQFEKVAQAIASISDPAERTTTAIALFGKSGAELLPVLQQTGEALGEVDAKFQAIGGPISAASVDAVDNLGDAFGTTALAAKSLGVELLALIAPPIKAGLDLLAEAVGAIRFGARGGTGDNEITNLSDEITRLQGKAAGFKNALNPQGQTVFRQLTAEIAQLQTRLDALTGTGVFGSANLEQIAVDPALIQAPQINFPAGPRQPTPEERRAAADAAARPGLDLSKDNFDVEEGLNQEHLDRLLEQTQVYGERKFAVESDWARAMADLRQQYGVQEIEFEELKSATIQEIGISLAQSGLQIATALFGQNKKVALAVAAINVAVGATEALKLPFPANLAAVAKVLAQGAQLVGSIRNTSIGGGGSFAATAGGGGAQSSTPGVENRPDPTGSQQRAVTQVIFTGPVAGEDAFLDIIKRASDRDMVVFRQGSAQAREILAGAG